MKRYLCLLLTVILLLVPAPGVIADSAAPNILDAAPWARDEIQSAYGKGIITTELLGDYQEDITRGEFVRLAMNYLKVTLEMTADELTAAHAVFPDRPLFDDTADPDLQAARKLGITNGVGGDRFGEHIGFDREMAAFMLAQVHRVLGNGIDLMPGQGLTEHARGRMACKRGQLCGLSRYHARDRPGGGYLFAETQLHPAGEHTDIRPDAIHPA
jgi:hypothetical protein